MEVHWEVVNYSETAAQLQKQNTVGAATKIVGDKEWYKDESNDLACNQLVSLELEK